MNGATIRISSAGYPIRFLKLIMSQINSRTIYFSYVHSTMSWNNPGGNSPYSNSSFKLQKRMLTYLLTYSTVQSPT